MGDTAQISVPVGPKTLGRIVNVIGEPIDEQGPVGSDMYAPIHAEAPKFVEMSELLDKLAATEVPDFELDLSKAQPAEAFAERFAKAVPKVDKPPSE